jgi:hypothetical protein
VVEHSLTVTLSDGGRRPRNNYRASLRKVCCSPVQRYGLYADLLRIGPVSSSQHFRVYTEYVGTERARTGSRENNTGSKARLLCMNSSNFALFRRYWRCGWRYGRGRQRAGRKKANAVLTGAFLAVRGDGIEALRHRCHFTLELALVLLNRLQCLKDLGHTNRSRRLTRHLEGYGGGVGTHKLMIRTTTKRTLESRAVELLMRTRTGTCDWDGE